MSHPFSILIARARGFSSAHVVIATVPAGKLWIVRDIDAYTNTLLGAVLDFGDEVTGGTFAGLHLGPASEGSVQWTGRQVFPAGESIFADARAGTWDYRISGYELDA